MTNVRRCLQPMADPRRRFDSDSVRVLSEINQPSQHLDLGTEKIGPHNPIDEMLDMASWSPDEIDALDWESTDFFRP